jgi:hypothetical protein
MEKAHKARARKPGAAWENAVLKAETPHRRDEAVKAPEGVKVVDQAGVPAAEPVEVAAKVAEKAAAGGSNKSTIQRINEN